MILNYILALVLAYLLGAIPSGLLLARAFKGVDVREYGSGRTGAANVQRTVGTLPALLVLGADLGKGLAAVLLAKLLVQSDIASVLAGLLAMVGHNWPFYLRFQGGRGVAVFFGGLLALSWVGAVSGGVVTLLTIALSRYVSLGSVVGAAAGAIVMVSLAAFANQPLMHLAYAVPGALLIIVQHRDNMARLLAGRERRLGEKAEKRQATRMEG